MRPTQQELLSHPHQTLSQHIEDILCAIDVILSKHSDAGALGSSSLRAALARLARLHDAGKATEAFQRYIRNPSAFVGDPREKAHTALSLVLSLQLFLEEGLDEVEAFALSQAILCHHSRLRTRQALIDGLDDDEIRPILTKQLQSVSFERLSEAIGEGVSTSGKVPSFRKLKGLLRRAIKCLDEGWRQSSVVAITRRLRAQMLYSVLLEADKAFLVLEDRERYKRMPVFGGSVLSVERFLSGCQETPLNQRREAIRRRVQEEATPERGGQIDLLALPTGMGKTLAAATWALSWKESMPEAKIIVVMPFLAIIEQTEGVYRELLGVSGSGPEMLCFHSLSVRSYEDTEGSPDDTAFFLDTWRANVVLTTYDQLLYALFSPKAKHQMRMHHLTDALIIMDELQSLPCCLWEPLQQALGVLCAEGQSRVLAMSATLPHFLSAGVPLLSEAETEAAFAAFDRYEVTLGHREPMSWEDWLSWLCEQVPMWERSDSRVLIVLNTRRCARETMEVLCDEWSGECYFLSGDVTPVDRRRSIAQIQGGGPCLVVATQCIEAGVDIDMDLVVRDFAPLDSIIQVAGRCNRHQHRPRQQVQVISLLDSRGRAFADFVYDPIHLGATYELLGGLDCFVEADVMSLGERYFSLLSVRKDTGASLLKEWATWEGHIDIRGVLRGGSEGQVSFVVGHQCEGLEERVGEIQRIKDKWERRRAWREVAGCLASVTVSIYPPARFAPGEVAREVGPFWFVEEAYYDVLLGLVLPFAREPLCVAF